MATPNPFRDDGDCWSERLECLLVLVVAWLLLAYLILPVLWRHYEHHPALESAPKTTWTQGIPGDPLNVGLIGTEKELIEAILGSGWDGVIRLR